MTPPDYYRANATALRALLRALPEPAQQDVVAAALALDHAAVWAAEFEARLMAQAAWARNFHR